MREITRTLQIIETETPWTDVEQECEETLSKIDDDTGAISAAGFFHITKEYVASVC